MNLPKPQQFCDLLNCITVITSTLQDIDIVDKIVPNEILVTECCNMTPIHRKCIQVRIVKGSSNFRISLDIILFYYI